MLGAGNFILSKSFAYVQKTYLLVALTSFTTINKLLVIRNQVAVAVQLQQTDKNYISIISNTYADANVNQAAGMARGAACLNIWLS